MVARRRARLGPEGPADARSTSARARWTAGNVTAWESEFFIPQQTAGGFNVPLVAATLAGMPADDHIAPGNIFQNSAIPYKFANIKTVCHRLETTPFRPSWIRTPGRMQNTYANECFIDELAAAANADPIEFRLKYLDPNDKRGIEVLNRAAALGEMGQAALAPARSARRRRHRPRRRLLKYELARTYVAAVAEVEVKRSTGDIRVTKFYLAHDCGQIINPDGLRNQLDGNVIQTVSRTLDGGAQIRPLRGDEPRLGELSDPDVPGGAGDRLST